MPETLINKTGRPLRNHPRRGLLSVRAVIKIVR